MTRCQRCPFEGVRRVRRGSHFSGQLMLIFKEVHTFLGCNRTRRSDEGILALRGWRRGDCMLRGDGIWRQWRE